MKTLFTTVSDDRASRKGGKYSESQDNILELLTNSSLGIDIYHFWKRSDIIDTSFYRDNKIMLDNPDPDMNGRCYKPFVVLEGLKMLDEGDLLIYNDVSPEMWKDFSSVNTNLYSLDVVRKLCADNGGILTAAANRCGVINDHSHENYTLERCINKMEMQEYRCGLQHASGMMVLQKSKRSLDFAEEWLHWNLIDECASLGPVRENEFGPTASESNGYVILCDRFAYWNEEVAAGYGKLGHRHDQSISGLLINRMKNKLVTETTGYCFLNFCQKDKEYVFVDSNPPMQPYRLVMRHGTIDGTDGEIDKVVR